MERQRRPPGSVTVWWIRRDLRLADNPALATAVGRGGLVVPVFVHDPALLERGRHAGAARRQGFLHAGLRALDADLRARGTRLVVRGGAPADVLARLVAEADAELVVAQEDVSPYARRRDDAVARAVPLELVGGIGVHRPGAVLKRDGTPFTVFSAFRRAWLERGVPRRSDALPAPDRLPDLPGTLRSEALPAGDAPPGFPAGEAEAARRLAAFARGRHAPIEAYGTDRNRLDLDGTSALSPYLRFGMVSARRAAAAARGAGATASLRPHRPTGADVWLGELIWREFYLGILWHFPFVLGQAFDARLRRLGGHDAGALAAWQAGRTGYPAVDAAMRQLAATGWIHNRARMLVASFLTKHLLVDWRDGEAWFMRQLVDGDPAANNGGWQWVAGTGTDAAPYFRVFNPVLQAKKFDPRGAWVRRWLPELAGVPDRFVHEPWTLSPIEQRAANVAIGADYPAPIVEHGAARARALAAWATARRGPGDAAPDRSPP